MVNIRLSYPAMQVKNFDNDRYLCSLFTESLETREKLFVIYAFNLELNHIKQRISDEMIGLIRLEWWREAIEDIYKGIVRDHPIIKPLAKLVQELSIDVKILRNIIDSKEYSLGTRSIVTIEDFQQYVEMGILPIFILTLDIIGCRDNNLRETIKDLAISWTLVESIRAMKPYMLAKHMMLPEELMQKYEINQYIVLEPIYKNNVTGLIQELVVLSEHHLKEFNKLQNLTVTDKLFPILFIASLNKIFLKHITRKKYDIFNNNMEINRLYIQWHLFIKALRKSF